MRFGREKVVGFGISYTAAKNDALLTLLQTTSYQFTSKLPDNVLKVDDVRKSEVLKARQQ